LIPYAYHSIPLGREKVAYEELKTCLVDVSQVNRRKK
jgi:hypothetical protein